MGSDRARVTSLSVDLHKYGYAPKGVSLLLFRDRDRHRAHWFATTRWPGYAVVNPTLLGSRSAMPIAAGWAVTQALGPQGFGELVEPMARATARIREAIERIEGLRVVGDPVGPLLAIASDDAVPADRRVDPHRWSDAADEDGWALQPQPRHVQSDGTVLPRTTHLTITPVTENVVDDLVAALTKAADRTRVFPGERTGRVRRGRRPDRPGGPDERDQRGCPGAGRTGPEGGSGRAQGRHPRAGRGAAGARRRTAADRVLARFLEP
ncbi:hypothetical protein P9209_00495 [Prescottella defluvii]|nr:hypothetical protein P9209_00495 [Prescottella defluvii]